MSPFIRCASDAARVVGLRFRQYTPERRVKQAGQYEDDGVLQLGCDKRAKQGAYSKDEIEAQRRWIHKKSLFLYIIQQKRKTEKERDREQTKLLYWINRVKRLLTTDIG